VVLGVASMIGGGLVGVWSAVNLAVQSLLRSSLDPLGMLAGAPSGADDPAAVVATLGRLMRELAPYTDALVGGRLLLSAALAALGLGLYRRRAWARPAAVAWSLGALAFVAAEVLLEVRVIAPRVDAAFARASLAPQAGRADDSRARLPSRTATWRAPLAAHGPAAAASTVALYAPFPVVLLVLVGRPSARHDFA
jgi:hypothetical protein